MRQPKRSIRSIACLGEVMIELIAGPANTATLGVAGDTYNTAVYLARSQFQNPCRVELNSLNRFDLLYLSGISMAILQQNIRHKIMDWLDVFREDGGTFAYDSNHRPRLWDSAETARQINDAMWARAHIALPSVDDEMELFGDATPLGVVNRLRASGVTCGALKRGAKGPLDLRSGKTLDGLARVANVLDSTAAGDSFNAGYLAALALGQSELSAARAGHDLATQVIQHPGAIIPEVDCDRSD